MDMVRAVFETSHNQNEFDFNDTELSAIDELYAILKGPVPAKFNTEQIGVEKLLQDQLKTPYASRFAAGSTGRGGVGIRSKG